MTPTVSPITQALLDDAEVREATAAWIKALSKHKYTYQFTWLGRPIIQMPQDMIAMQELLWSVQPDLVIETGIAHGGSLIFHASLLELIGGDGQVLGVDIDIREHNRVEIEKHPMFKRISMIQGSSIDDGIAAQVRQAAQGKQRILVILDSNHTHEHVLRELELYAPLVTPGSYMVVMDTLIEDMEDDAFSDRQWGKGNNPKTAVHQWLQSNPDFVIDPQIEGKLLLTVAPDGFLKRLR